MNILDTTNYFPMNKKRHKEMKYREWELAETLDKFVQFVLKAIALWILSLLDRIEYALESV